MYFYNFATCGFCEKKRFFYYSANERGVVILRPKSGGHRPATPTIDNRQYETDSKRADKSGGCRDAAAAVAVHIVQG